MTEATAAVVETPEVISDEAAMAAVWDKANEQPRDDAGRFAERPAEAAESATDAPSEGATEPEATAETPEPEEAPGPVIEPPGHLPREVKEAWADMPEAARDAISRSQAEMARNLGEANRERQAIRPIYDQVVRAAQELPQLANMTPGKIAEDVFALAKWAAALEADPAGTLIGVAQQRGVDLRAALDGQQQSEAPSGEVAALNQKVAQLEAALQQYASPEALHEQITMTMQQDRIAADVSAFAASKPAWNLLQHEIMNQIPDVRDANPHLSPREVLELTYNTVEQQTLNPLISAAAENAVKSRKAEAARAAKSINVSPDSAGKPAPMTDDEMMSQIWDRNLG